jgi:hypothetical protein
VRVHLPRTQSAAGGSRGWFRDRASPRGAPAAPVRTRCAWPSASRASWDAPPTRSVLSTGCHHPPSGSGAWCGRGVRRLATPVARARCHRRACAAWCVRLWRAASAVRGPHTALGPRDGGDRGPWTLARVAVAKFAGGEVSQLEFFRRRSVCVLRATSSARGCNSEPGPPPGIKLRGHELDCSLGALTLTRTRTRTPNLTLTLTLNQTGRT